MGCDIHLYVERKENAKWITCDRWVRDADDENRIHVEYDNHFYTGRNYNLFAILADVRNGRGFAGIKTGEGFNPISSPRGIPEDASTEYKESVAQWDGDGHSHSYFTVQELMKYDWTQVSCLQGWVDISNFEEFERWKKRSMEGPNEYCGDVLGGKIQHITNDEMHAKVEKVKALKLYGIEFEKALQKEGADCYTLVEWETPYYKAANQFLSEVMPRLWHLGNPEDVRIVFYFDN